MNAHPKRNRRSGHETKGTGILTMANATPDTNVSFPSENFMSLTEISAECNKDEAHPIRLPLEVVVFILALLANAVLLGLLLKNRRSLTPSEVLGLNFALLGLLFCSFGLTLDIGTSAMNQRSSLSIRCFYALEMLSYFGCPLLLTCMCVERYVAVSHPVLFMKLGKWEYRAACSAIIWILTSLLAVFTFFYTIHIMALPLSVLFILMFLTMVACLLGIVRVLCKKGPGDGDQDRSPMKKRALKNILAVLIPSAIIYSPLLALPVVLVIAPMLHHKGPSSLLCAGLNMFSILPNFGVCIGPMFYMGRVRQMLCNRNNDARDRRETTANRQTINSM